MSLLGTNTLIVGDTGTGKTYSIRTLIEAGITPFIIFTEPGMRTIADVDADKLHWHYVKPASVSFDDLTETAKKINTMSFEAMSKLKDMDKRKYQQLLEVMAVAHNFTCDRTGESFGDVSEWNTDRAIIVDSLTGLSKMAMDLVVGAKPTKNPGDWGVAMDILARLLDKFADDTRCHYVLIAHLEREKDEITGASRNMPSTLGQKLAPKIGRNFDDIVMAKETNGVFTWATTDVNTALKNRNLPKAEKLEPSFVPLIESWKSAGGVINPTETKGDTQ